MCTGDKVPTLSHWLRKTGQMEPLRPFETTGNFTGAVHQGNQDLCVTSLGQRALKRARGGSSPLTLSSKDSGYGVCVSVGLAAVSRTAFSTPSLSLPSPSDPAELQPWLFTLVPLLPQGKMPAGSCRTLAVLFACSRGLCWCIFTWLLSKMQAETGTSVCSHGHRSQGVVCCPCPGWEGRAMVPKPNCVGIAHTARRDRNKGRGAAWKASVSCFTLMSMKSWLHMKIQSSDWAGWEKWHMLSVRPLCLAPYGPSPGIPVRWGLSLRLYSRSQWQRQQKENTEEKEPH